MVGEVNNLMLSKKEIEDAINNGTLRLIAKSLAKSPWVSLKEKFPQEGTLVLVKDEELGIVPARLKYDLSRVGNKITQRWELVFDPNNYHFTIEEPGEDPGWAYMATDWQPLFLA